MTNIERYGTRLNIKSGNCWIDRQTLLVHFNDKTVHFMDLDNDFMRNLNAGDKILIRFTL